MVSIDCSKRDGVCYALISVCPGCSPRTFCGEVFVAVFCRSDDVVGGVVLLLEPVGAVRRCWCVCPAPSGFVCLVCCGDRWFRVAVARGEERGDERVQGEGCLLEKSVHWKSHFPMHAFGLLTVEPGNEIPGLTSQDLRLCVRG